MADNNTLNTITQTLWQVQETLCLNESSLTQDELAQVEQEVRDLLLVLDRARDTRHKSTREPARPSA